MVGGAHGGVKHSPRGISLKFLVRQRAHKAEYEFLVAINDELVQLAKPDLCNEAERLGLETAGTKKDLRQEILHKREQQWREEQYPDVSFAEIDLGVLEEKENEEEDDLGGDLRENVNENAQADFDQIENDADQDGGDDENVDELGQDQEGGCSNVGTR